MYRHMKLYKKDVENSEFLDDDTFRKIGSLHTTYVNSNIIQNGYLVPLKSFKRGWTRGIPNPYFPPPFTPFPSPSPPTSLPLQPHFRPPVRFSLPLIKFVLVHELKRSQEPKLIIKIAYQRPICIFRGQRVKTYFSLLVFMLNPF